MELLQNADDQSIDVENSNILIKLTGNKLIIANNGEPFSTKGIASLMHSNLSSNNVVMNYDKLIKRDLEANRSKKSQVVSSFVTNRR